MKVVMERLVVALLSLALALPTYAADKEDKNKGGKKDPDAIGEREVDGGSNFYSLEKEIALGKSMAQQV